MAHHYDGYDTETHWSSDSTQQVSAIRAAITIIENLEGPFLEEDILESQLHLKNFLESKEEKDAQKAYILSEIALKIKEINQSLMD